MLILIENTGFRYLILGSVEEYKYWFPKYGLFAWGLKNIFSLIFLIKVFLTFRYGLITLVRSFKPLKKGVYFFSVIFLTFLFDEVYPFSFYPMYNHFPNWSYSFYFTDDDQNIIELVNGNYTGLSHQYAAVAARNEINYGSATETKEELLIIGKELISNSFSEKPFKTIRLFRIHNYFDDQGKIASDTILMATTNEK